MSNQIDDRVPIPWNPEKMEAGELIELARHMRNVFILVAEGRPPKEIGGQVIDVFSHMGGTRYLGGMTFDEETDPNTGERRVSNVQMHRGPEPQAPFDGEG